MNNFITPSAKAKILNLISAANATSMRITVVDDIPQFDIGSFGRHEDDIILSVSPFIYTDSNSLLVLSCYEIDYNYHSHEFIISRPEITRVEKTNEFPINA